MNVYFDNAATTKVRDEVIDDISNVLNKWSTYRGILQLKVQLGEFFH